MIKRTIKTLLLFLAIQTGLDTGAQVAINTDGSDPLSSAILDVKSTVKGMLLPRMTTSQRNAIPSPAVGLFIYNTDDKVLQAYTTSGWHPFEKESCAPAQPGTISGALIVCDNQTGVTYSITAILGAAGYHWTVPPGAAIVSGQGTTGITANMGTQSGDISVRAESNCGNSANKDLAVSVGIPAQPSTMTGDDTPCENQGGYAYSIASIFGATNYNWTVPAGATIESGQGTTDISVAFGTQNGNVSVRAENICGNSSYKDLAVTLGSIPAQPGVITGPNIVTLGQFATYSIATVPGATNYNWAPPSGAIIMSGQGTTSVQVIFGSIQGGFLKVRAENSCGNSNYREMFIFVILP